VGDSVAGQYPSLEAESVVLRVCSGRPDATVFVAAKHDQYIPAQGAIADKWEVLQSRWRGASVQWIRGGHVSAILFPKLNPARIVTDVVKRLLRR
jgi:hypothetical protein